jgi:tryptophan 2,3-dioxygenase
VPLPAPAPTRDLGQPQVADPGVQEACEIIYRDPQVHRKKYELGEKRVDFEDCLGRWRFNHVTPAERVIGLKRGTTGTSGVGHLRRMPEVELFPELWHSRTAQ